MGRFEPPSLHGVVPESGGDEIDSKRAFVDWASSGQLDAAKGIVAEVLDGAGHDLVVAHHRQHVVGIESSIDLLQPGEALDQQSRTDQQDERQRDLCDNKDTPQAAAAGTLPSGTLTTLFERVVEVQARCLKCRR